MNLDAQPTGSSGPSAGLRRLGGRLLRFTSWRKVRLLERRVTALEVRLQQIEVATATLDDVLYTAPYSADDAGLQITGSDGALALGFDAPRAEARSIYSAFEDVFRGSEEFIRARQRYYVDHLSGRKAVVDLGCGRGELLDLLDEANIRCTGVDPDEGAVATAEAKGHRVVRTDALTFLQNTAPGSLDAIISLQFIEHIDPEQLVQLLQLSVSRLAPGGLFIAETVNPHSISALRTFWVDLTHQRPIFPETLLVLCRASGFSKGRVVYPTGTGDAERDRRYAGEYAIVAET